jgi:hypothetical protein
MYLLIQVNRRVAAISAAFTGTHYEGKISLEQSPPELKRLFEEYEEIVEGQMFGLLDSIEAKVGAIPFRVSFEDGGEAHVEDLQVFPSTGSVSFKMREPVPT